MAYYCHFHSKPVIWVCNTHKGICLCVSSNVCVQYLGGNEGGRRGDLYDAKNFRSESFKNALCELLLYLFIVEAIFIIMKNCGDDKAAIVVVKSLTYVFMYVYLQNAFRNLIKAYPTKVALRIIYHVIRLEFTRVLPGYWQPIIERYQREHDSDIINDKEKEGEQ